MLQFSHTVLKYVTCQWRELLLCFLCRLTVPFWWFLGQAFSNLNGGQSGTLLLDVNMKLLPVWDSNAGEMVLLAFCRRAFRGWLLSLFIKSFQKVVYNSLLCSLYCSPKLLSLLSEACRSYAWGSLRDW